jgi:hypothetical protein
VEHDHGASRCRFRLGESGQRGRRYDLRRDPFELSAEASGGFHIRKKAAPATPYTITAGFIPDPLISNFHTVGLCFRDAGGKLGTFSLQGYDGAIPGLNIGAHKYNSPTSYSGTYLSRGYSPGALLWLRIADNGTNRICSVSGDGVHWRVFHTIGRTDFLTATEVGFFLDVTDSGVLHGTGITLVSWLQA